MGTGGGILHLSGSLLYDELNNACAVLCPVVQCVWLFETPRTVAHQAPLSTEFSRQEYWSRLPCPFPGDLSDPGVKLMSLPSPALAGGFFTNESPGKPFFLPMNSQLLQLEKLLFIYWLILCLCQKSIWCICEGLFLGSVLIICVSVSVQIPQDWLL